MQEEMREAERRIEEARRTGANTLDLGALQLSELPDSLGDLPDLRALYLGRMRPGKGGEPEWASEREKPDFADLSTLAGLQGLQHLNLSDCGSVTDLAPIAGLQALQSLDLWSTGVMDLAPIAGLQALQSLDLQWCTGVTDLAPIARLQALKSLGLGDTGVTDRDQLGLLREIRRAVRGQRIGEKPQEMLTLGGTTVARSSLSARTNDGRAQDTGGAWVAAGAFAAFFEGREYRPEEALAEEKRLGITPRPRDPDEKPREVFISYAWGDDTPEGKIRAQVVDALQEALARQDGFLPIRDRDQIKNGELISAFIRRLTRADLVVAVISDKYLRSTYCMHEIYRLWQRYQANPGELAQHLVPIVLPEVKIGNVRERLPYLKYWAGEAKSLEEVVRDPDIRPGRESWEEVRLVREFSHHIDDILVFLQDVLMPKALDAHLGDGFPAVLEALRRRIGA